MKLKTIARIVLATGLALQTLHAVAQPSFDCTKATTLVENAICQDSELGALDETLAEQYQAVWRATSGESARQALKKSQRAWLAKRNQCQDRPCLVRVYRERLDALDVAVADPESKHFSHCRLDVRGQRYIDGPCTGSLESDGSFQIYTPAYFAMIQVEQPGVAVGFWNEDAYASHAHSDLGRLARDGACWSNAQAQVCAWK
ncbi:lysozyme inhibitor LprI family protein [Allochromatium tepidum]|uniref:Lysozyme inhibitor LprI-like N-terminal domain-containing protein n=1 Tax=Allochromatium tepidum TaxID=553982 RepID=A0ABM7QM76_9GAMM|nr:lysozyme inhibitor LprI family protein [Allochromatium tepidum]BCU06759.1 hypothetical protein Atep_14360 [Allochromatium tepidum]